MKPYREMSKEELASLKEQLTAVYKEYQGKNLSLNMARGKPSPDQLDLSLPMLDVLNSKSDFMTADGDVRNYGVLTGIQEAKELMGGMMDAPAENVIMYGSASLTLMYDTVSRSYTHGVMGNTPWCRLDKVKFLCPVPGYDRHFAITQFFGIEMINIPLHEDGPDMDLVEEAVKDPAVKGMWCVPKYSNPDGIVYSDETIARIAALKPAAPDFALMWDNAYCIHEFDGDFVPFQDILTLCREAGNPDMVYEFASTSKVTLPGAGFSVMATSEANQAYLQKLIGIQTISYDKVNSLRHVRYLKDKAHTLELMKKHAAILNPKFQCVLRHLDTEIAPLGIASWQRPKGGYFVSVNTKPGLAKRTLALCKEAGVVMTGAGATFPYGRDPQDSNIRIAPSLPPVEELEQAMEIFCTSLRLAALEQQMQ